MVNGTRGLWPYLEVVLWGQIPSSLSGSQQSSPIANSKHESAVPAPSSRNGKALPNWQESVEVARISWNTPRSSLVHFSLRSEDQRRVVKTSEALQSVAMQEHPLWGYIYILSRYHMAPQASAPAKRHMPSHMSASTKHPLTMQIPEKYQVIQPSF